MGVQPILTVTVSVRKIKGGARQHYVDVKKINVAGERGVNRALVYVSLEHKDQNSLIGKLN